MTNLDSTSTTKVKVDIVVVGVLVLAHVFITSYILLRRHTDVLLSAVVAGRFSMYDSWCWRAGRRSGSGLGCIVIIVAEA